MPIHDWTRVDAGLFHDFHQRWAVALSDALNAGTLPAEYVALVEQNIRGPIADVLTLEWSSGFDGHTSPASPMSVMTAPPQTRVVSRSEADIYASRADRVAIRHRHGDVVAVIEIVSPGNKASRDPFRTFVAKSLELLRQRVHLLIIDPFPPGRRDPQGIHPAIWGEFVEEEFTLPPDKPLTMVSYDAGPDERVAYVEPVAVGDRLPSMPLFLAPMTYVPAPLEASYEAAWRAFPLKRLLVAPASNGAMDHPEA